MHTENPGFAGLIITERVAFLLTDATRAMPSQIAALLGRDTGEWLCPQGDHSTTLGVYQGVKAVLEQWADLDRTRIAVDVTGGLKPMSVGLEKAAHLLGLTTLYIQSNYDAGSDDKFGPIPGSERLVIPLTPYTVFGDIARELPQLLRTLKERFSRKKLP